MRGSSSTNRPSCQTRTPSCSSCPGSIYITGRVYRVSHQRGGVPIQAVHHAGQGPPPAPHVPVLFILQDESTEFPISEGEFQYKPSIMPDKDPLLLLMSRFYLYYRTSLQSFPSARGSSNTSRLSCRTRTPSCSSCPGSNISQYSQASLT